MYDLSVIRKPHIFGQNGRQGMKLKCNGRNGSDIRVTVPLGTLVYDITDD